MKPKTTPNQPWDTSLGGLDLERRERNRLRQVGIAAVAAVTLQHQESTSRYVVRGIESGGGIQEIGRYITFASPDGEQLERVFDRDCIGVNGPHGEVVNATLARIDVFRFVKTYRVLITTHCPKNGKGSRTMIENKIILFGAGRLDLELWGKDRVQAGSIIPNLFSLSGERLEVPKAFEAAVRAAVRGAACVGCKHSHFLSRAEELSELDERNLSAVGEQS